MSGNDKLESIIQVPHADRKGVKLVLERPSGVLNTVAMRLVVSGKMQGQERRQLHSDVFTGEGTIPLPDDFLPTAAQGWVRAVFSVADPTGAGARFLQRATLVFEKGQKEALWDDFSLQQGAVADFITLTWTVVE
ncbi:hypothetical protein FJV41_36300 [Myxococcus llanfairpwllgwyngyllgogerychwyrndrobwllllantysiliogogogochensis]|uniref:Uncharacterized protein n=1 Tax=Myxococcus llanfairpwllgwyngyllgogerychwyrndrobwllllantysiliogogogochensis TaxID=2590453 RepID=A0A540WQA1_9BACT|nr:hypothetical protein [Myxococcus llanfairpwllgwyngyllgogerychwyrndrobwllllantysiliogogogochensis]TQF11057.1 hypothetical protein FJV41_36300 [Myxococcus llanfairpwllgwyngyllgogerychwyrndrobwllllantysiliogogogochensis]